MCHWRLVACERALAGGEEVADHRGGEGIERDVGAGVVKALGEAGVALADIEPLGPEAVAHEALEEVRLTGPRRRTIQSVICSYSAHGSEIGAER